MGAHDLTGIWQGLYSYAGIGPHVGFTATLLDMAGALHGTTHEKEPWAGKAQLDARLSGRRAGQTVAFTKVYAVRDDNYPPVAYDGTLSPDGTEIEGTWTIDAGTADQMSGRFLMSRPERRAAMREMEIAARR